MLITNRGGRQRIFYHSRSFCFRDLLKLLFWYLLCYRKEWATSMGERQSPSRYNRLRHHGSVSQPTSPWHNPSAISFRWVIRHIEPVIFAYRLIESFNLPLPPDNVNINICWKEHLPASLCSPNPASLFILKIDVFAFETVEFSLDWFRPDVLAKVIIEGLRRHGEIWPAAFLRSIKLVFIKSKGF